MLGMDFFFGTEGVCHFETEGSTKPGWQVVLTTDDIARSVNPILVSTQMKKSLHCRAEEFAVQLLTGA